MLAGLPGLCIAKRSGVDFEVRALRVFGAPAPGSIFLEGGGTFCGCALGAAMTAATGSPVDSDEDDANEAAVTAAAAVDEEAVAAALEPTPGAVGEVGERAGNASSNDP